MPDYQKQTGTDGRGNPVYATAHFKKKSSQSGKKRKKKSKAAGKRKGLFDDIYNLSIKK